MKKLTTLILASALQCGMAQTTLLTNLQGCYPLDCDRVANQVLANNPLLNGTEFNVTCTTGHTGVPGTAYQFAGNSSSRIELPDNVLLKPTAISFSGWFRLDNLNPSYLVFTKNPCSTNQEAYSLGCNASGFSLAKASGSGVCNRVILNSSVPVTTGVWYHVGFYIDNSVMEIYVNGVQNSTTHNIPWGYVAGKKVILGGSQESFDAPFQGRMDNLRFYNRRLLSHEFNFLYKNDPRCDYDCPVCPNGSGIPDQRSLVIRETGDANPTVTDPISQAFPSLSSPFAKMEVNTTLTPNEVKLAEQHKQIEAQKLMIEVLTEKLRTAGASGNSVNDSRNEMSQNEPNPFANETRVDFNLSNKVKKADLVVYDLFGKQVATFPIEERGNSFVMLQASKLSNGVYVYSIVADGKVIDVKRMVVAQE